MIWVVLIVLILSVDQISKLVVINNMKLSQSISIIENFFYLTYCENSGIVWGIFKNSSYVIIPVTIIISALMVFVIYKTNIRLLKLSLSLIIGGAVGNLIDRLFRGGSVIDFLDVYIGTYNYPVFNVADSFIVIGTFVLAYYLLFVYKDSDIIFN